ncbi:hypothetical protein [Leptospira interrogans]
MSVYRNRAVTELNITLMPVGVEHPLFATILIKLERLNITLMPLGGLE